ncbi:GFA family protein [Roseibium salinum]|uniref:GFA family protein n=1 Tax=Roseibium salinum TaxID=1604349 RepID=A0ABT3QZ33_9HYPH|nr:GFA family protein [Roseibium sp. DSM 29163]MCX2722209.1 GFA family protein [Roseibium sp. DSM 29163]
MSERLTGGCLCEAVRYVCEAPPKITVHCYCTDCRKIGGTGHATHSVFDEDVFLLTGRVSEFEKTADSGRKINRRFCPVCGSALFHTRTGMEGLVVVRTSSLDDPDSVTPEWAIYVSRAVSWDHVDTDLQCFEEMTPQAR